MFDIENFRKRLIYFDQKNFETLAFELFCYQYDCNKVYQSYCNHIQRTPYRVKKLEDIPFLPIEFFKTHVIKTGDWQEEKIFQSSGTTSANRSRHHVRKTEDYLNLAKAIFEENFGPLDRLEIIALLPSYIEQGDSSLIAMMDHFITLGKKGSGYFLDKPEKIKESLNHRNDSNFVLFGVSYALLDLAENQHLNLPNAIIIETGGMKGRRKEITRKDLHESIIKGLSPSLICSEYGMTELTSQAYSKGEIFHFPKWAKAMVRDINDPFSYCNDGQSGGLNIIDLGNVETCAFIETKDLGKIHQNGGFEILGRYDNSDVRGCNLMVE